jgi:uroporphyrinogen decarboxylase
MEEFWFEYSTRVYEAAGGKLDIFYMADDYGMQDRMLISPACWRRVFKPIVKRFMDWGHARGLKTMLHSCGSIRPIIPDLIECGLDILDPIQPLANGMNPFELKREFGKDLCFHGGVDIQELLPHGKPQEVREAVKRLTEEVGKDGGYILAPAHQVQSDVPAENVLAIFLDPE